MDTHLLQNEDSSSQATQQRAAADDEASFSESSESTANVSASTKPSAKKRKQLDKGSDEYRKRREKNNEAVKKSRIKSKAKTVETQDQVNQLIHENQLLNQKVASLTKEFELLKDLYQAHAKYAPSNEPVREIDLRTLMDPEEPNLT